MERPYLRIEDTGEVVQLRADVTTVGRGSSVDIRLRDPSVSKLHAEIVCRGNYAYVADLGLSRNGTRVNGRPAARRVLEDGDVLSFGSARCRIGGLVHENLAAEVELRRQAAPELTRRETDVLTSLCRPALSDEAFVAPATAREIASDLVVTEAAVKQHLLRLYQKFRIAEGPNRRTRLANEVVALGLVRPLPAPGRGDPAASTPPSSGVPAQGSGPSSGVPGQGGPAQGGPAQGGPGSSGVAAPGGPAPSGVPAQGGGAQGGGAQGGGAPAGAQAPGAPAASPPTRAAPRAGASRAPPRPGSPLVRGAAQTGTPAPLGTQAPPRERPGRPPRANPPPRDGALPQDSALPQDGAAARGGAVPRDGAAPRHGAATERLPDRQAS